MKSDDQTGKSSSKYFLEENLMFYSLSTRYGYASKSEHCLPVHSLEPYVKT
jgi:hypothetical protein